MPTPETYESCLDELRATRNLCMDLFDYIYESGIQDLTETDWFQELRERMIELEFF